jgi:hypothetical protein
MHAHYLREFGQMRRVTVWYFDEYQAWFDVKQ